MLGVESRRSIERAREESRGRVRWLRPEFQNPGSVGEQGEFDSVDPESGPKRAAVAVKKIPWPKTLPAQVQAVRDVLLAIGEPVTLEGVASRFTRARKDKVAPILETLVASGQARMAGKDLFVSGR